MGCGSSRAAKNVVAPAEIPQKDTKITTFNPKEANHHINDNKIEKKHRKLSRDSLKDSCGSDKSSCENLKNIGKGSQTSLNDSSKCVKRGQSAKSNDSGLGDYEDDKQIITEKTELNEKTAKELEIRPSTPELIINGSTFKKHKSAGTKSVLPEIKRYNSLISTEKPNSNQKQSMPNKGGMAFDIILAPETNNKKRRPNQLPILEKRKLKRKETTKQELEAKQKAAMQRRKHHEEQLIAKATAYKEREKKVQDALQKFAEKQTKDTQEKLGRLEQSAENRKTQLESLRKSFREKDQRAKKIRRAKQQLMSDKDVTEKQDNE
ncbi:Stathmin-1-A [Trichoplax sp. H2]|nr:Stathmin-1-A [Trichoplax sp. H2]|eukprot:RDD41326.1 Stathmin-1-A [Trichoplax sp. H2]